MGRGASGSRVLGHFPARRGERIAPLEDPQIDPQLRRTFYRSGELQKPSDYAERNSDYVDADSVMPDQPGRVGRVEALFVSDDLRGLAKWTRANLLTPEMGHNPTPRELFYTGPEPWAYPVLVWSAIGVMGAERYWREGLPLRVWEERRSELAAEHIWSEGAEILLDPKFVKSSRAVSFERLAAADPVRFDASLRKRWRQWRQTNERSAA